MREIAAEAGFANGGLKHYFAGKDDLLAAAFQHTFFRINERGHITVHPFEDSDLCIDIRDVVEEAEVKNLPMFLNDVPTARPRITSASVCVPTASAR